jgi:hypothetical protein
MQSIAFLTSVELLERNVCVIKTLKQESRVRLLTSSWKLSDTAWQTIHMKIALCTDPTLD